MAQLNLIEFTPATTILSSEVNSNFGDVQTLINAVRPTIVISELGDQVVSTSLVGKIPMQQTLTFVGIELNVDTAPVGADLIIDVKKNGTSIFSTKPQVTAGETTGGGDAVFSTASVADGDYLTFTVDQVGSTTPGENLTIALIFKY